MKLAKVFGESGVSAVHLEDQLHGGKKCGHQGGKVLVPMSEHVSRLIAARMQWDIMGLETLLIARTDAESAKLISGTADGRDHEFVLGVETWEGEKKGLAEEIARGEREGRSGAEIDDIESSWMKGVQLVTFDEGAFVPCLFDEQRLTNRSSQPSSATSSEPSLRPRRRPSSRRTRLAPPTPSSPIAKRACSPRRLLEPKSHGTGTFLAPRRATTTTTVESRCVLPSRSLGTSTDSFGLRAGCDEARSGVLFARGPPLARDQGARSQAGSRLRRSNPRGEPRKVRPRFLPVPLRRLTIRRWLVYNLSPSFNWSAHGFSDEQLKSFIWDLGKAGFVLQLISLAGLHSTAVVTGSSLPSFAALFANA